MCVKRGADASASTDHYLLVASKILKLLAQRKTEAARKKFSIRRLVEPDVKRELKLPLQNIFFVLENLNEEYSDINNIWVQTRDAILITCE